MNRSLIVARIRPGSETEVARIFGESDSGRLPRVGRVVERSLYSFHDLYLHLIDFEDDVETSMAALAREPEFKEISARLAEHISAYDPDTWREPRDAMARRFYHWRA